MENKTKSLFYLLGKQEIFQALVSGMHISLHTGELYRYLQENPEYFDEFETLGYKLIHEQDYYYLENQGEYNSNDYSRRCLVFISIMLESIATDGADIIESFYRQRGFEYDQLPHFKTERYKNYMQYVDITKDKLNAHLKRMHRSGFIEFKESENFILFLSPCHRFLQLSLEILEKHQKEQEKENV